MGVNLESNVDTAEWQIATKQQYVNTVYKSPNVICSCGSKIFHEAVVLKKISALMSGTGREELVPIPVYVCDKCGKIPDEFTNKSAAKMILGEDKEEKEEKEDSSIII